MRLTRLGRVMVLVVSTLVGAFSVGVASQSMLEGSRGHGVAESVRVQVLPGDNAWGLAQRYRPDVDPRVTVAQIEQLNGLSSAGEIEPGQLLEVPVGSHER